MYFLAMVEGYQTHDPDPFLTNIAHRHFPFVQNRKQTIFKVSNFHLIKINQRSNDIIDTKSFTIIIELFGKGFLSSTTVTKTLIIRSKI